MSVEGSAGVRALPPLATTGIGSLPHTQLELALQLALAVDIPYLPQLPRKDPAEYMIPQALEGLPGMRFDEEGRVTVRVDDWRRGAPELDARLERALNRGPLAGFEPGGAACAWPEFLWEVESRKLAFAKVQIAGPITARWGLRLDDGRPAAAEPGLEAQLDRLVLARALAMARAIRERGATPLVFLDEPAFYLLDRIGSAGHDLLYQEVRLFATALRHEGARVGLHCCGNADWTPLLGLGLDVLSFDARLSLQPLPACREALLAFAERGGRLALGIVPTNLVEEIEVEPLVAWALATLEAGLRDHTAARRVSAECLLTPACGLGLRTVVDCERIFEDLGRAQRLMR